MSSVEFEAHMLSAEKKNTVTHKLVTGWYESSTIETDFKRTDKNLYKEFNIHSKPILLAENFSEHKEIVTQWGQKALSVQCDKEGTKAWAAATKRNINKHLIFILDDEIISIPMVNAEITNGAFLLVLDELSFVQQTSLFKTLEISE